MPNSVTSTAIEAIHLLGVVFIMEKFTGDFSKRLSKEEGLDIRDNGQKVGESESVKGSYWSGYEKDGKCYISLNDEYDCFWEVSQEDLTDYCL